MYVEVHGSTFKREFTVITSCIDFETNADLQGVFDSIVHFLRRS